MKSVLRWALITFALPLVGGWFALPPLHRIVATLAGAAAPAALVEVEPAGHGAYCRGAARTPRFLGRDLPELGSYSAFQTWCEKQGGEVDWTA